MEIIRSTIPPTLFKSPVDGTIYAVAGGNWQIAPPNITLKELRDNYWIDESDNIISKPLPQPDKSFTFKSSKGDTLYEVTLTNNHWHCTCPGFGYHRGQCRHLNLAKSQLYS